MVSEYPAFDRAVSGPKMCNGSHQIKRTNVMLPVNNRSRSFRCNSEYAHALFISIRPLKINWSITSSLASAQFLLYGTKMRHKTSRDVEPNFPLEEQGSARSQSSLARTIYISEGKPIPNTISSTRSTKTQHT